MGGLKKNFYLPTQEQLNRMGADYFSPFFVKNISKWRGIPHAHKWDYDNYTPSYERHCGICGIDQETYNGGNSWHLSGNSYYRRKIVAIEGNSYKTCW